MTTKSLQLAVLSDEAIYHLGMLGLLLKEVRNGTSLLSTVMTRTSDMAVLVFTAVKRLVLKGYGGCRVLSDEALPCLHSMLGLLNNEVSGGTLLSTVMT
jgi:hypothetical protein